MASGGIPWPWKKDLWLENIQAQKKDKTEQLVILEEDGETIVRGEE